jgi:methyl-accepting chemotaxis protein
MKLSIKAILSASSIATLVGAALLGVVAISGLKSANDGANQFNDEIIPGVRQVEELNVALGDMRIAEGEVLSNPTPAGIDTANADISDAMNRSAQLRKDYEAMLPPPGPGDAERAEWQKLTESLDNYTALDQDFFAKVKSGDLQSARAMFTGKMDELYTPLGASIDDLVTFNLKEGEIVNASNDKGFALSTIIICAVAVLLVAMAVIALMAGIFVVSRPLDRIVATLRKLSDNDLKVVVPHTDSSNEVGNIARALEILREGLAEASELRAAADAAKTADLARLQREREIVESFQGKMIGLANAFVRSSGEVSEAAQSLSATAEETARQAQVVTGAAEEAATNVQTVAAATEEMTVSIREIGSQVQASGTITADAASEAQSTQADIRALADAAQAIGEVVNLINNIASQTNLLALNATIESARAGEAGRGFAVVAAEVKQLAQQTGRATEDISRRVAEIQTATQRSVEAIERIVGTVEQVRGISTAIAAAVEQQGAATDEIAGNTARAADGTTQVTDNIFGVGRAAEQTGAASTQLMALSGNLSHQAADLKQEVDTFVSALRAA